MQTASAFLNKSWQHLDSLQSSLEALTATSDHRVVTQEIRAASLLFNSIRENAIGGGFDTVAELANAAENFLQIHCTEAENVESFHLELLTNTCNLLADVFTRLEKEPDDCGFAEEAQDIIQRLEQGLSANRGSSAASAPLSASEQTQPEYDPEMLELFISESLELLENVEETLLLLEKHPPKTERDEYLKICLRHFHTLKGNSNLMGITPMERVTHAAESILGLIIEGDGTLTEDRSQLFLKMIDIFRQGLTSLSSTQEFDPEKFREIHSQLNSMVKSSEKKDFTADVSRLADDIGVELWLDSPGAVDPVSEQGNGRDASGPISAAGGWLPAAKNSDIRIGLEKLDSLVNLVGELVTVTNLVSHSVSLQGSDREQSFQSLNQLQQITSDLRELAMSMRMIPISKTFRRMTRVVRDISLNLGKEINLTTDGETTEIDKTLAEQISDPILHIIRNAIDHGIENPEERKTAGKSPIGNIHLKAMQVGNEVWVSITDDGQGLDRAKILDKAQKLGLIDTDVVPSDPILWKTILEPGFSTSETLSELSGRGMGMNVVKRNIENLSGSVDISSRKDHGTTFTLRLPLTMAIIDTLLVRIAEEHFSLPLSLVRECVELTREDIEKAHGRHLASIHGQIVPYIRLREKFAIEGECPEIEQIVVVEQEDHRVGLVVDCALDQHLTIIKSLGKVYADVEGISGATILGDGTVALILDVHKLLESVVDER